MGFPKGVKEKALIKSRRCCCVCHKFAGRDTNVHHIKPRSKKGTDTLDNAIVLCLKCHSEVGHYNNSHPIGNKYTKNELIQYRDNWWKWCKNNPYEPLPDSPIIISPSEIPISPGEWSTISQIGLFNKTDAFIYQIWIKIIIQSNAIMPNDIELSYGTKPASDDLSLGKIKIYQQMYRVEAIDQNNDEVLFLVVEKLEPKTNYMINLTVDAKLKTKDGDYLDLYIASFSTKPSRKSKKKDHSTVALSIRPSEDITLKSISLLMRKEE